jgi:glutathione S-transferase
VWTALKEKGLAFDVRKFNLEKGEHKNPQFQKDVLTGKIPALQIGDLFIPESIAIVEFLEEAYPAPKYPSLFSNDLTERTKDRAILSWLRTDFGEMRKCMPFEGLFFPMEKPQMSELAKVQAKTLVGLAKSRLGRRSPSIADYDIAFTLRRLIHYGFDFGADGEVRTYSDNLWNKPSVESWVKQTRSGS